jgi:phosphatidylglycerol:prolipoprotein diacylglycerol transferase
MSRGQTLCMIMVIAGLILFVWEYKKEHKQIPNAGVHQSAEK